MFQLIFRYLKSKIKPSHYCQAGDKGEMRYSSYSFMTSALMGVSGQHHASDVLYLQEKDPPSTYWTGGWVDIRAGVDTVARVKVLCLCWGMSA
jgi:hypothetical protein